MGNCCREKQEERLFLVRVYQAESFVFHQIGGVLRTVTTTVRTSGIALSEPDTFLRELVDIGSLDSLPTLASQLRVSQVVSEDEDNVRLPIGGPVWIQQSRKPRG